MHLTPVFARSVPLLLLTLFAAGCSGPNQDVRLTLCQGLVEGELSAGEAITWHDHQAVMEGYEDLEMRVRFERGGGEVEEAVCYYPYEQEYAEAQTFSDPTSAYSSNPSRMVLRGEPLEGRRLGERVNAVMMKQGREVVQKVAEEVKKLPEKLD